MLLIKDLMRIYLRNGKKLNTFSVCLALIFLSKIVANSRQLSINQFFNIILKKCLPLVALRQWTMGSKKYKIPVSISLIKGTHLVAKWIMQSIKFRRERTIELKLLGELIDILEQQGQTLKFRKEHHLVAFDNKSFIRFLRKKRFRKLKKIIKMPIISRLHRISDQGRINSKKFEFGQFKRIYWYRIRKFRHKTKKFRHKIRRFSYRARRWRLKHPAMSKLLKFRRIFLFRMNIKLLSLARKWGLRSPFFKRNYNYRIYRLFKFKSRTYPIYKRFTKILRRELYIPRKLRYSRKRFINKSFYLKKPKGKKYNYTKYDNRRYDNRRYDNKKYGNRRYDNTKYDNWYAKMKYDNRYDKKRYNKYNYKPDTWPD